MHARRFHSSGRTCRRHPRRYAPQPADPALANELIDAADAGNLDAVKDLLARGADVNAKKSNGTTPLYAAAQGGHEAVCHLLVEKGADLNAKFKVRGAGAALGEREGARRGIAVSECAGGGDQRRAAASGGSARKLGEWGHSAGAATSAPVTVSLTAWHAASRAGI